MSQSDVLGVIEKSKKPIVASEIAKKIKVNTVCNSLKQLIKYKEIKKVMRKTRLPQGSIIDIPYYYVDKE